MNRIDKTFKDFKLQGRKTLIGYITAGFPTKGSLRTLVPLLEAAGIDILELGVPFSDPIADGPTIQYSSQVALSNGVTLKWVLQSVRSLRVNGLKMPLILMSYCNPIHAMGIENFFRSAKSCGVDGLIIPDMIPEEARPYSKSAKQYGVDLIYLVSPTTPKSRIRIIGKQTRGFLYAVSLTGVTGARKALSANTVSLLKTIKSITTKPVAVGFGISTPEQVRNISRHSDGVIVGSELIRQIDRSRKKSYKGAVRFVESLKQAIKNPSPHPSPLKKGRGSKYKELSHAS